MSPNDTGKIFKLVLVEDHPIFRQGLAQLIAHDKTLAVVGEAESIGEAIEVIDRTKPDLVLLDISLKGSSGLELLKVLRTHDPSLPVLVLSMFDESLYAERALRAGARGYLMKQQPIEVVRNAIHTVLKGKVFLSEETKAKLLNQALHGGKDGRIAVDALSDRELEVLMLTGKGFTTKKIAQELSLSTKTVESHRAAIKQKLQLADMTAVVRFAVEWVAEQSAK
jgi:DNA-binding NarL/FixJ family response regulator